MPASGALSCVEASNFADVASPCLILKQPQLDELLFDEDSLRIVA